MAQSASLRRTALNSVHRALGAKMVEFGGWDMPVQFTGIIAEHMAVRQSVGVFDISHMGEIEIRGPQAAQLTDFVTTNSVAKLRTGQAHYTGLLYEHGGFVDDILVHKVADPEYFLCVNAANQEKDFEHIRAHNHFDATVELTSDRYSQFAIQGPHARATLQKLTPVDLGAIKYYWFADGEVCGVPARIAHTGYTGEDGFEIYFAPAESERVWARVLEAGAEFGIQLCGLGARNTLRLEAAMALYGHEIDASISPLEAGLGWIVKFEKPEFIGREALLKQRNEGVARMLTGFAMTAKPIARDGYEVQLNGVTAGRVTSGSPAPALNRNIGLCYLPLEFARPGVAIQVVVRGQPADAMTVEIPFYKRAK